jgi:hypothetical protein
VFFENEMGVRKKVETSITLGGVLAESRKSYTTCSEGFEN